VTQPTSSTREAFRAFEMAGWEDRARVYLDTWSAITGRVIDAVLDAARVESGRRVLDVATGGGDLAAAAVARGAVVTAVDASPVMVAAAAARLPSVDVLPATAESLPFPPGVFDAVVANFLMPHLGDHEIALASLRRVACRGARIALTTWDDPRQSRHLGIIRDAIADVAPEAPAGIPAGPDFFRYADNATFASLLTGAGLSDVRVDTIHFEHRFASFGDLWRTLVDATVRTRVLVVGHPADVEAAIRSRAEQLAQRHRQPDGSLLVPISVKLGSGAVA